MRGWTSTERPAFSSVTLSVVTGGLGRDLANLSKFLGDRVPALKPLHNSPKTKDGIATRVACLITRNTVPSPEEFVEVVIDGWFFH